MPGAVSFQAESRDLAKPMHSLDLPEPDADAKAVSTRLCGLIADEINRLGPMPFQRYMELALYAPGLGYYAAGAHKFGAAGDFVTAPELGSVMAEAIAETLAPLLRSKAHPTVMELGAGSGVLAVDLLAALERRGAMPDRYLILERSADLRQRQQQRLKEQSPDSIDRVSWLDRPPESAFDGAIIGNEVVDALACARFEITADGPRELCVQLKDNRFQDCLAAPRVGLSRAFEHLQHELDAPLLVGYQSELVPELSPWLASVSACLRSGLLLLADYGYGRREYYHPQRSRGTLICHYRQRVHEDPYWYPGLNDITASVDFTALAEAGHSAGLELLGYDNQAGFLIGAGIEQIYAHLAELDDRQRLRLAGEIKRLMLPGEMGERFKLMLLGRGLDPALLPAGLRGLGQRQML
jgi:SAM-dependent MidA family methyltransferase